MNPSKWTSDIGHVVDTPHCYRAHCTLAACDSLCKRDTVSGSETTGPRYYAPSSKDRSGFFLGWRPRRVTETSHIHVQRQRTDLGPWPCFPQCLIGACGHPREGSGEELPVLDSLQISPFQRDSPTQFNVVPRACFKPGGPG